MMLHNSVLYARAMRATTPPNRAAAGLLADAAPVKTATLLLAGATDEAAAGEAEVFGGAQAWI